MIKYNFILVFYFSFVSGEECDENVCYRGVKTELERLRELCNKSPTVSNIPSILDDIHLLINRTENIIFNIKNLEDIKNDSQSIYDTILHNSKKLELMKIIIAEVDLMNTKLNELRRKKNIRYDAFNECVEANNLYGTLRDDLKQVKQIGKDLFTSLDVSKHFEEIKKQSLNIKNNLDDLRISETLFQNYVCNSRLRSTVLDIINSMREIANILQTLFEGVIKSKLNEIENNIGENAQNIKDMKKSLDEEVPTTDVKITNETRLKLENLRKQIEDLKNKIKQFKIDKTFEDLLENVKKQLKDLLNEYKNILNYIFSKQNMQKVKEEIETAKETLQLLEERDTIKTELEIVKEVVDTLQDRGICFINETVSVEDKIIQP